MSDREPPPATRVELLHRIEAAWAALDRALVDLDAHQLAVVPAGGDWSIKDHLAHLAAWASSASALLAGKSRPAAVGVDDATWATDDVDRINAAIEQAWVGRNATDVLTALRTAQAELRELIGAMDDEDLAKPYSHFQPNAEPYDARPVIGWIAGDTYDHVADHLPAIETLRAAVN